MKTTLTLLFLLLFFNITAYSGVNLSIKQINSVILPADPVDIEVNGNYAYITCSNGKEGVLIILDMRNPEMIPEYYIPGFNLNNPHKIAMLGAFGYIANDNKTISVFNFSGTNIPSSYGSVRTNGDIKDLFTANGYLYAIIKDFGLQVYDISFPSNPLIKNFQIVSGNPTGLFVDNKYAYVTTANGNLTIVDISNVKSIPVAGKYSLGFSYNGVYADENYVYIAQGQDGVQVVDAGELPAPKPVTRIHAKKNAVDVKVNGNYTWVNDQLTLQAYYNKDVKNQIYAGSFDNMGFNILNFYVTQDGKYIYLCSDNSELKILKVEYNS